MQNRTPAPQPSAGSKKAPAEPSQGRVDRREKRADKSPQPVEIGGRGGLDPTRYGDWEKNGRCIDF